MQNSLRQFVYLDEVSLNNSLSSLGKGIPEELVEQKRKGREGLGMGRWGIPSVGIGGKASYKQSTTSNLETRLTLTLPYQFHTLLKTLREDNIPIYHTYDNPPKDEVYKRKITKGSHYKRYDPKKVDRGDLIELPGQYIPMAIFRCETMMYSFISAYVPFFASGSSVEEIKEIYEGLEDSEDIGDVFSQFLSLNHIQESFSDEIGDLRSLYSAYKAVKDYSSNINLRMEYNDVNFGIPLRRRFLFDDPYRAFSRPRRYTVFGRIEYKATNRWDPLLESAANAFYDQDSLLESESDTEDTIQIINMVLDIIHKLSEANQPPKNFEDDLIFVDGDTMIIHPIAVFW